jgi:chorismate mutase
MELYRIRDRLIELEDIIIKGLWERSNYKQNLPIYEHNAEQFKYKNNYEGTYFDFMFKQIENVHSIAGRYNCFDERPFYKGLQECQVTREYNSQIPEEILKFSKKINFSPWIKIAYLNFITELCEEGEDAHYGDSILSDIFNLQAVSKRIHYGILVMEAKYKDNQTQYDELLTQNNDIAIGSALKNVSVEQKVLQRVREKSIKTGFKKPGIVVKFFKNCIIPMTIQVELDYIFSKRE